MQAYSNADSSLKSAGCGNRDFYAGKCQGIQEVLDLENDIANEIDAKPKVEK
jgi:hypothetical protein